MQSVDTDPTPLVHPRAASVSVLAQDEGLCITEITVGTLHFSFRPEQPRDRPFLSFSLKVDGSFVTLSVPRVLGLDYLRTALEAALPEGYLALGQPSDEGWVVTIARSWQVEPPPTLFCSSFDTTLRAKKLGPNRFVIKGIARGRGDLRLRINDRELRLPLAPKETSMEVASRVREVLEPSHITLLTVADEPGGEVVLTVLPRR